MEIYEEAAAVRAEAAIGVASLDRGGLEQRYLETIERLEIEKLHRMELGREIGVLIDRCRNAPDEHMQRRWLEEFLYGRSPTCYDQHLAELRQEVTELKALAAESTLQPV